MDAGLIPQIQKSMSRPNHTPRHPRPNSGQNQNGYDPVEQHIAKRLSSAAHFVIDPVMLAQKRY